MRLIRPTAAVRVASLLAILAVAACDDNPSEPTTPASISASSGQAITGRVGDTATVLVTVLNSNNNPLTNQSVTFAVTSGGGTVTSGTATTNGSGQATTRWVLGTTIGPQLLTVTSGGVSLQITAAAAAGAPRSVSFTTGASQTTTVNGTVATAPSVTVRDAGNNPVAGVQVQFSSSPGGTVNPQVVLTDANGVARLTSWQLGATTGTYTLTATVLAQNVTGNPATITAQATAGSASQITTTAGNNVTATAGSQLAGSLTPAVVVRDAAGNPVAGVQVTFSVVSGGGTITGATQTTNAQGVATVGGFTLGRTAGPNVVQATAAGAGTATFAITGAAGPAAAIVIDAGNNQAVPAGQSLTTAPSVRVVDAFGNPVAGANVTFSVGTGGGTVTGGTVTTNALGVATVGGFRLGATPGTNTIVVSTPGAPNATITASGLAGAPSAISIVSGNNQNVGTFTAATQPLIIKVVDAQGFGVQGQTVTFAIGNGSGGTLSAATVTTDASGLAQTAFTSNGVVGANNVTATVGSLNPVVFTVNTVASNAVTAVATQGQNQTGTAGSQLPLAPVVQVKDSRGLPAPGVTVYFSLYGESIGTIQADSAVTDQNGLASPGAWTLGATPGQNILGATIAAAGVAPIVFTATGVALPAGSTVALVAGTTPTSAAAGSNVPLAVIVRNAQGQPVQGVTVRFSVGAGGGNINGTNLFIATTDASGIARVPAFTLGTTANQANTVVAQVVNGPSVLISVTAQ